MSRRLSRLGPWSQWKKRDGGIDDEDHFPNDLPCGLRGFFHGRLCRRRRKDLYSYRRDRGYDGSSAPLSALRRENPRGSPEKGHFYQDTPGSGRDREPEQIPYSRRWRRSPLQIQGGPEALCRVLCKGPEPDGV